MKNKLMFTGNFCKKSQPLLQTIDIKNLITTPYNAQEHGKTLDSFQEHPAFNEFKEKYFLLVDQFTILSKEYQLVLDQQRDLDNNLSRFKKNLFDPGYCNGRPESLWNLAREYLEATLQMLKISNKTTEQKADLLKGLAPNLTVCVDGIVSYLQNVLKDLVGDNIVLKCKEELVEQLTIQFIQDYELAGPNENIHITNAFVNLLASSLGLIPRNHEQTVNSDNELIQKNKEAYQKYLFERLPFSVVSYLTDELLSARQQALQTNQSAPWKIFVELPISQWFEDSDILHSLFTYEGSQESNLTPEKVYLLQIKVASHLIKQQWLQESAAQKPIQLQSGELLHSLADRWLWIQMEDEERTPATAAQLVALLQHADADRLLGIRPQALQLIIEQDPEKFTQLLTTGTVHPEEVTHENWSHYCRILGDSPAAERFSHTFSGRNIRLSFNNSPTLSHFLKSFPETAMVLIKQQQLTLLQGELQQSVTPTLALICLLERNSGKIPEPLGISLLDHGADVNSHSEDGCTLLMHAGALNQPKLVNKLLTNDNTRVNQQTRDGISALMAAVATTEYNPIIVEALLKHPNIDTNLPENNGHSAFLLAVKNGSAAALEQLLNNSNIDFTIKNKRQKNALHLLISGPYLESEDRLDKFILLLGKPAIRTLINDVDENEYTPLMYLVSQKMDAKSVEFEMLKTILSSSEINVNVDDKYKNTTLHRAFFCENLLAAEQLLLHPTFDPNTGKDADTSYLQLIIRSKFDANKKMELIKKITKHDKFDPNVVGRRGNTPLLDTINSCGSQKEKLFLTEELLENSRINPNLASKDGTTPVAATLWLTDEAERTLILEKLLQHPTIDKAAIQREVRRWGPSTAAAVEAIFAKDQSQPATCPERLSRQLAAAPNTDYGNSLAGSPWPAPPALPQPSVVQPGIPGFTRFEQLQHP